MSADPVEPVRVDVTAPDAVQLGPYTCEHPSHACRRVFPIDPADPMAAHRAYLEHMTAHDDVDAEMPGPAVDLPASRSTREIEAPTVSNVTQHQAWCTDHLSEDPSDPLSIGVDECATVVHVLPARGPWRGVDLTASQDREQSAAVLTIESYSRPLTVAESRQLYIRLGGLLARIEGS